MTPSPYRSQCNSKAESAVKTAKELNKKAVREIEDPWKAVQEWLNTPTTIGKSRAKRLMGRRTRTMLPTAIVLFSS